MSVHLAFTNPVTLLSHFLTAKHLILPKAKHMPWHHLLRNSYIEQYFLFLQLSGKTVILSVSVNSYNYCIFYCGFFQKWFRVSAHVEQLKESFKEMLCFRSKMKLRTKARNTVEKLDNLVYSSEMLIHWLLTSPVWINIPGNSLSRFDCYCNSSWLPEMRSTLISQVNS